MMTPADPFDRIPDPGAGYAGTVLETPQERAARKMRDCPLTCEYCDCAPATHLLVADLVKPAGGRATDLVCGACGEAGVRDAAQISESRSSVWLFALIPAGKPADPVPPQEG